MVLSCTYFVTWGSQGVTLSVLSFVLPYVQLYPLVLQAQDFWGWTLHFGLLSLNAHKEGISLICAAWLTLKEEDWVDNLEKYWLVISWPVGKVFGQKGLKKKDCSSESSSRKKCWCAVWISYRMFKKKREKEKIVWNSLLMNKKEEKWIIYYGLGYKCYP